MVKYILTWLFLVQVFFVLFFIIVPVSWSGQCQAVQNGTQVSAQRMIFRQHSGVVEFSGAVFVQSSQFKLWCDRLKVYMEQNSSTELGTGSLLKAPGGGQSGQIKKIVALGQVRVSMASRRAQGEKAVYDARKQLLTLEGNVLLEEDRNKIRGRKVIVHLDRNVSEIRGGKGGRVEAVFFPKPGKKVTNEPRH